MFDLFQSWRDERILNRIVDGCEAQPELLMGPDGVSRRPIARVLRDVVKGLRAEGLSPTEILALIAAILTAIQAIGDAVAEIIDRIRGRS